MRLQHEGDPYPRSDSWKRTSQNGTREDKGSKRMENTNEDQRCRKFPWICQFLPTIHSQPQSYRKTIKRTERKKGMEIGKGTSGSIRRTQRKDYKLTGTGFTQERRKIQGRNRCIRTCNWRSTFPRARREMETHCIFIKDDATSRTELRNLRQETIGNCRGLDKMATIFAGRSRDIRDMDGSRKPEVL